ncbi:unnamed protein product [Leptosia nina]|uniref:Uncharacterized protein n=1 Tax=Leptosia nina TaxID=320188 RepID=A0AAV1JP19_9NEOP
MAEKAINQIQQELNEYSSTISLSNNYLKSQKALLHKLKQESEREKLECTFINNSNRSLLNEIKEEEIKLQCLNSSLETIQSGNVEGEKELLLTKERRSEIEERVTNGIKKYEEKWSLAKKNYEDIPYMKDYLNFKNKLQTHEQNLKDLINDSDKLSIDIKKLKREVCVLDKEHSILIARFLTIEKAEMLNKIAKYRRDRAIQSNDIKSLSLYPLPKQGNDLKNKEVFENTPEKQGTSKAGLSWPCFQQQNNDLDMITAKLDQIRKDAKNVKRPGSPLFKEPNKKPNPKEYVNDDITDYFMYRSVKTDNIKDYSNKKLIHIIEDIQLNEKEAHKIIAQADKDSFKDVTMIGASVGKNQTLFEKEDVISNNDRKETINDKDSYASAEDSRNSTISNNAKDDVSKNIDTEKCVSDVNSVGNSTKEDNASDAYRKSKDPNRLSQNKPIQAEEIEEIDLTASSVNLLPPTQFMDTIQRSQEKKVTFNINESVEDMQVDDTVRAQTSVDSYAHIKDTMFKKYNLDISPQFMYGKDAFQMKTKEYVVRSKFFDNKDITETPKINTNDENETVMPAQQTLQETEVIQAAFCKADKVKPVSGLLFTHGSQGILESLELSATAEYEEGDSDYPHGIDASLLMSPKADDIPTAGEGDDNKNTEQAPNFLTGIRKTGFSLFGGATNDDNKSTSGSQENNHFSFSFGGDQKKKGGLFNMFR